MYNILQGNCIEVLKTLPENSVDSVVTDPPYGLEFMGKEWDAPWKNSEVVSVTDKSTNGIFHDKGFNHGIRFSRGLFEMQEFQKWSTEWAKEVYRVLKPGGYILVFGGSRTYHRMACAIEEANFEIRDQIMWVYGSGFPKSMAIDKAIDKKFGAEREVVGRNPNSRENATKDNTLFESGTVGKTDYITKPSTEEAQKWEGWGTALKPAHEPIVMARKPLDGTVVNNVLKWGVGGINIDESRVPGEPIPVNKLEEWSGFGQKVEPEYEQEINNKGRFPANFIHDGDEEVVELFPRSKGGVYPSKRGTSDIGAFGDGGTHKDKPNQARVMGDDGSAARFFYCPKANSKDRNEGLEDFEPKQTDDSRKEGNPGGDNPRNRGVNLRKNNHPTVKPTALMRYLVKMVTPVGGTVLDPFTGSGSTGKAAVLDNFNFIGIEMSKEYVALAEARIKAVLAEDES